MRAILALVLLYFALGTSAYAQNTICPTRAAGDNSNACASTAYVLNALKQSGTVTPVQFGATCNSATTLLANMPDDTAHLQAAINFVQTKGGVVELGACTYKITSGLVITTGQMGIEGVGNQVSNIVCQPTATVICFKIQSPTNAVVYKTLLYNFGVHSADVTFTKSAFEFVDVSESMFDQLGSYGWTDGAGSIGGFFTGGTGSVCFNIFGRELSRLWNTSCAGDLPIVIQRNPNSADISLDSWDFNNLYLLANGHPNITMLTGICITNVWFRGTQNWIFGTNGLEWVDTTATCASQGLYISGVKAEQAPASTGWMVLVQVNNRLQNLVVSDSIDGDRQGINVRKVQNTIISNVSILNPGGIGYDVDGTAGIVQTFTLLGNFFQTGVLCNATNISSNFALPVNSNASSQCVSNGFFGTSTNPASLNNVTYPISYTSGGIPYASAAGAISSSAALANHALVLGGGAGAAPATPVGLGTTTTVLHGNAAGAPSFGAVDLSADVTGTLGSSRLSGSYTGITATSFGAQGQYQGTSTNDSATAGNIGELLVSDATLSSIPLTSSTPKNIISLPLTAGDWDVTCMGYFLPANTTTVNSVSSSISTVTDTVNIALGMFWQNGYAGAVMTNSNYLSAVAGPVRVSLSGPTTYYCVADAVFGTSTMAVGGRIRARRMR